MDNENKYSIPKEKREELGNYIRKARLNHIPKRFGINELAEITNTSISLLSKLENGKIQRITPFLLQDIAKGLEIDYKILYKIVGYLNDNEKTDIIKRSEKKSKVIIWERGKEEIIDISSLSKDKIKSLKKYINFLKIDLKEYEEFIKWKKEKAKENKIRLFYNNISNEIKEKCKINYTESTVNSLFEDNKIRLNKAGREFYKNLINFFGGENFFDELKDENGNQLPSTRKEYQIGKIVRYYATNVPLSFK